MILIRKIAATMFFVALINSHLPVARAQAPAAGGFTFKARKQTFKTNGARLEGDARISSPQLDVAADAISFDFTQSQIQKVTARGSVNLKINLTPQGGGEVTRIEATCKIATLDPPSRTLILDGAVKGFYQVGKGGRNELSGSRATLKYDEAKNLLADIEGGVSFKLPAENLDSPTAIGSVVLTGQRATVNTATGLATISGNARAVSSDGPNKFDVAAPVFTLSRGASGTIDTLKTVGRTSLKLDLPPDATPDAAPKAGATPATNKASDIGKPTRLEVMADAATVQRAGNTVTFEGNVQGFYELAKAGAAPTRQTFSGDRAVVKYVLAAQASAENPAGVQLEMTGKPVEVMFPQLNFSF